jgi:hypothetical protein
MQESVDSGLETAMVSAQHEAAANQEELAANFVKQTTAMQGSASALVSAAGTGFKLEPEAAAILIKACKDSIDELDSLRTDLSKLQSKPQLGTLPGAQEVAEFTQSVATDGQGIIQGVAQLRATLVQMEQAYRNASTNYQQTEQMVTDMLNQQGAGLSQSQPTQNNGWEISA